MSIFDRFTELDPALALRRIEAAHGSAMFDRFAYLDPQHAIHQIESALDIDLDDVNGVLGSITIEDEIDAALEEVSAPEWLPENATAFLDFRAGQYYADGGVITYAGLFTDPEFAEPLVSEEAGYDPPPTNDEPSGPHPSGVLDSSMPLSGFSGVVHFNKTGANGTLLSSGGAGPNLDISLSSGTLYVSLEDGGYDAAFGATSNAVHKISFTVHADGTVSASRDGGSVLISSAGAMSAPFEQISFGGTGPDTSGPLQGTIYSITLLEPVLDAALPALSA